MVSKNFSSSFHFVSVAIISFINLWSFCQATDKNGPMDGLKTPPPSPTRALKTSNNNLQEIARARSQSTVESPAPLRKSAIERKRSEKYMSKNKLIFPVQTEDELLTPQYIYMSGVNLKSLPDSKQEEARRVILKILSTKEHLESFLESPGWLVKLSVHPTVALEGLSEAYYDMLSQKDERYPDLLIQEVMKDTKSFEKLLSWQHITFSQLLSSFQGEDISKKSRCLEEFVYNHKPYLEDLKDKEIPVLNPVYWKALGLFGKLNPEKAAVIKTNAQEIIERFLKEEFSIPQNFYLFFYGLPKGEKRLFSSLYRFTGERLLYSHPGRALSLIKISSQTGDPEALITLGLYHQHLSDYKKAKRYFTFVSPPARILCNLGAVYESLGEKEKALECYEKLRPESLIGKYRLLKLYELLGEKEKALTIQTHIMSTLKQLEENARCHNPIEAAVVSVLLGKPEAAKKFIGFSKSNIDKTNFSPHKGELHFLSAFVKYAIEQYYPGSIFTENETSHLTEIKKWATTVLEKTASKTNQEEPSPFVHFSLMTGCIGSYSLLYFAQTSTEQILADFDKHIPQRTQKDGSKE